MSYDIDLRFHYDLITVIVVDLILVQVVALRARAMTSCNCIVITFGYFFFCYFFLFLCLLLLAVPLPLPVEALPNIALGASWPKGAIIVHAASAAGTSFCQRREVAVVLPSSLVRAPEQLVLRRF